MPDIVTNVLYQEIDQLQARVKELEAENEKLRAERIDMLLHPEKYFSCYRDLKVVAAENAALRAELDRALSINNPCLHTGLESFVCEVCGYPDPRKAIILERDRLKAALMDIASAGCNEACEWLENDCDKCMLETAQQALRGGEEKNEIEEFKNKIDALKMRYASLKSGEALDKLTSEERRELHCMETGHGWSLRLTSAERHEIVGFRSACEQI